MVESVQCIVARVWYALMVFWSVLYIGTRAADAWMWLREVSNEFAVSIASWAWLMASSKLWASSTTTTWRSGVGKTAPLLVYRSFRAFGSRSGQGRESLSFRMYN